MVSPLLSSGPLGEKMYVFSGSIRSTRYVRQYKPKMMTTLFHLSGKRMSQFSQRQNVKPVLPRKGQ